MLVVIAELCENGNLEDFMVAEGAPLSPAVKLDIMLQVAAGLEQLKEARVLWRDLKAKNLLVRDVQRGRTGEVCRVIVAFTDWGTAVKMPPEGKRRMTLHGPGTAGYIAPDTRGPIYDYQADMWAYLVWAASMCLRVEFIVDCQLEEALADLALEKKIAPTAGHEDKVDSLLRGFEEDGKVEEGCEGIFELVRTSSPWVDATLRWTPEEAKEEIEVFRGDHGLVIDVSAVQQRRVSVAPRRPAPPRTEQEEQTLQEQDQERCGLTTVALLVKAKAVAEVKPQGEDETEEEDNEDAMRQARGFTAAAPSTEEEMEDDPIAETDDDEEEEEHENEEAENENEDEGEDEEQEVPEPIFPFHSNPADEFVGLRVRKWFKLALPRGRPKKNAPKPLTGAYFYGTVVRTHEVKHDATGQTEMCCFVRYDDGDEEDLTVDEVRNIVFDKEAQAQGRVEVQTDREADLVDGYSGEPDTLGSAREVQPKQRRSPGRASKSSRKPTERSALGTLSSNDVHKRGRGRPKESGQAHSKGAKAHKEADVKARAKSAKTACTALALSPVGLRRRGRKAPEWAVAAVDVQGVKLGCPKCRQSRYGCTACRIRNGVTPDSTLMLGDGQTAAKTSSRKRSRPALDEDIAIEKPYTTRKALKVQKAAKPAASASTALVVPLLHIDHVSNQEELKAKLPPGVELGCSKCRYTWRGCTVCRTKAGVYLPPSKGWHRRRSNEAAARGLADLSLLALPCPGDELRV